MSIHRFSAAICLMVTVSVLAACKQENTEPANDTVGHQVTGLSVHVGSAWGGRYSVDVAPQDYVVVEHRNCPDAKETGVPENEAEGLCVLRITKEQSDRFQAAMERFKRNAVPLQTISLEDWPDRPDGKPCRNSVTDATHVSLTWNSTKGAEVARFYFGCDREEFSEFYKSVLTVTDPLPIGQIIKED